MRLSNAKASSRAKRKAGLSLWALVLLGCFALVLVVAGCGGGSGTTESGAAGETSAEPTESESASSEAGSEEAESSGGDYVAEAEQAVEKAEQEVTGGVPTSSPPVAKGKSVVLIPCAAAAEGCSEPMDGAAEAAKVLGWKSRTIDGKGTPAGEEAAIEQAIALKPDAIIIHAIDPSTVKGAVKDAKAAGIPVIASSVPPSPLVDFSDSPPEKAWIETGEQAANFLIAETNGEAKYVQLTNEEFGVVKLRTEGFEKAMEKCTGCEAVESSSFTFADMASKLPQLTQQLLQANPTADSIVVPFDAAVPFVLQGEQAIGKNLLVTGGDGTSEGLKCIREECGLSATGAVPVTWIGWTDIDAANRIFNNEDPEPASVGLPTKLIVPANVQEEEGTWNGDVDFASLYEKLWKTGS